MTNTTTPVKRAPQAARQYKGRPLSVSENKKHFYVTASGNRVYVKREDTTPLKYKRKAVKVTANNKFFTVNENGNKAFATSERIADDIKASSTSSPQASASRTATKPQ